MKRIKERLQANALSEWRAVRAVLLEVAKQHPSGERESLVEIAQRLVAAPTAKPKPAFSVGSWCIRISTPDAPGLDGEWLRPRVCRVTDTAPNEDGTFRYQLELFEDEYGWNEPTAGLRSAGLSMWHTIAELLLVTDARVAWRCAITDRRDGARKAKKRAAELSSEADQMVAALAAVLKIGPVLQCVPDV